METLIGPESPLRRVPANLDLRQMLFIDAIRYSIEMSERAYTHLCDTLLVLPAQEPESQSPFFVAAMQDAWTMVDAGHRLHELLDAMPGVKKKDPETQLIQRKLTTLKDMRHGVQHLRGEIDHLIELREPVWGSITWLLTESEPEFRLFTMVPGTVRSMDRLGAMPPPRGPTRAPIDEVTLHAFESKADLSDVFYSMSRFTKGLEEVLTKQFAGHPTQGADLLVNVGLRAKKAGGKENRATSPSGS
jgi:hypothetical protein